MTIKLYNSSVKMSLYTTLTNFSTKYLVMFKVYTDVGGINGYIGGFYNTEGKKHDYLQNKCLWFTSLN